MDGCADISRGIMKISSITQLKLNLTECDIRTNGLLALSSVLKDLPNLRILHLSLSNNQIDQEGVIPLCEFIR